MRRVVLWAVAAVANTSGEPRKVTVGLAYAAPKHERIRSAMDATSAIRAARTRRWARWLQEAARSGGCRGEYWEINEPGVSEFRPWFMTAAGNVLYAICQLFVADQEGGIQLAAGVPSDWTDYSFRLPAPGGYSVLMEVKGGKVAAFSATPRRADLPRPAFNFHGQPLTP